MSALAESHQAAFAMNANGTIEVNGKGEPAIIPETSQVFFSNDGDGTYRATGEESVTVLRNGRSASFFAGKSIKVGGCDCRTNGVAAEGLEAWTLTLQSP